MYNITELVLKNEGGKFMKRKLLAMLTTLAMMLTLLPMTALAEGEAEGQEPPVTTEIETGTETSAPAPLAETETPTTEYVAQIGTNQYTTLQDAITAANSGDTVTLIGDVVLDPTAVPDPTTTDLQSVIAIDKDLTIDLAAYSITWDQTKVNSSLTHTPAFFQIESTVTIKGNGTIDAEAKNNNSYGINVNGGSLTIEGGTFYGAMTAVQVQKGNLCIKGGTFDLAPTVKSLVPSFAKYIINVVDASYKDQTATIAITGGTFVGFDPSDNPEGAGTSYLPKGSNLKYDPATGNIVKDASKATASVNGVEYSTLGYAINAANNGDTVTLLENSSSMSAIIVNGKKISLNLNGNTVKFIGQSYFQVNNGGGLNLVGPGTIDGGYFTFYMIGHSTDNKIETSLTIGKDVTVTGGQYPVAICEANGANTSYGVKVDIYGSLSGVQPIYVSGNIHAETGAIPEIHIYSGASVSCDKDTSVYLAGYAKTTVDEGAVMKSADGSVFNIAAGELTINGGTFTGSTSTGTVEGTGGAISTTKSCGIYIKQHSTKLPVKVEIKDGTFSAAYALMEEINEDATNPAPQLIDVQIKGGSFQSLKSEDTPAVSVESQGANIVVFDGNFSAPVDEGYLAPELTAELYSTVKNSNAPYSYYTDKAEAVADAIKLGGDVRDLYPETAEGEEPVAAVVTLDNRGAKTEIKTSVGSKIILPALEDAGYDVFAGWVDSAGRLLAGKTEITVTAAAETYTALFNSMPPYIPVIPTQPTKPTQPDTPDEPDTPVVPAVNYVDVSANDWFYDEVAYVTAKGLMTGTTPTTFAPNATTTRAMVWTILGRMSGAKVDGGEPWYSLSQSWAMSSGVSDGTNPNGSITREELAVMLYRYAGSPAVGLSELAKLGQFIDGEAVSDWAQEAMAWAVSTGIISGSGSAILPQQSATRAQVAAMLMRFCELNNK